MAMRVRKLLGGRVPQGSERFTAPRTSFNGRISPHRRFTFGQLALDDVKAIKDDYGCTVNDAIMSICAGAVRRWLIEHDELPDQPLVAQVPVSVRSQEQIGTYGNRILLMSAPLFTNVADPVERLHRTHEALGDMKERHQALPATLLQDANHFIPPAVFHRAAQLTFRLSTSSAAHPTWNLVISKRARHRRRPRPDARPRPLSGLAGRWSARAAAGGFRPRHRHAGRPGAAEGGRDCGDKHHPKRHRTG